MQINERFDWFIAVLPPGPSHLRFLVRHFEIDVTVAQIDFQLLNHF